MLKDILAELVFYRTYAETKSDGFKETWDETVSRSQDMHVQKYPQLEESIKQAFDLVRPGIVVPSMRGMQFSGPAIQKENARLFNCSYAPLESFKDFADLMYLLLCGTGVGYSVQYRHISQLPVIQYKTYKYCYIEDNKEAWCDSIITLLNHPRATFDYSAIRPEGASISTGGTASGPGPLKEAHEKIRKILLGALDRQLTSLEAHDIMCHVADSVVVGGVRRSAMISLFDSWDEEMLLCKAGEWYKDNPQRARSNNSVVINKQEKDFKQILSAVTTLALESKFGEPGLYLTNDCDWGTNPCCEIALKPRQLCNLTEINASRCRTPEMLLAAASAAAFIGTLQASYTEFNYIRPEWKQNQEEEALLGVSITGQAENPYLMTPELLRKAATVTRLVNELAAKELGINAAARITCVKPSGTTSAVLSTTSGIHAEYSPHYLRRIRVDKTHPIGKYLLSKINLDTYEKGSYHFLEQDMFNPKNIIVAMPVKKEGAILRENESAIRLLTRMQNVNYNWIQPGYKSGANNHNVSLTVEFKEEEKQGIHDWMLSHHDFYTGISLLPYDGGSYIQTPFEQITEEQYNEYVQFIPSDINLAEVDWRNFSDLRQGEMACAGGSCELK